MTSPGNASGPNTGFPSNFLKSIDFFLSLLPVPVDRFFSIKMDEKRENPRKKKKKQRTLFYINLHAGAPADRLMLPGPFVKKSFFFFAGI